MVDVVVEAIRGYLVGAHRRGMIFRGTGRSVERGGRCYPIKRSLPDAVATWSCSSESSITWGVARDLPSKAGAAGPRAPMPTLPLLRSCQGLAYVGGCHGADGRRYHGPTAATRYRDTKAQGIDRVERSPSSTPIQQPASPSTGGLACLLPLSLERADSSDPSQPRISPSRGLTSSASTTICAPTSSVLRRRQPQPCAAFRPSWARPSGRWSSTSETRKVYRVSSPSTPRRSNSSCIRPRSLPTTGRRASHTLTSRSTPPER